MHNSFFNLTLEERQLLISKTADHMDVSEVVIEKDLWVCWLLEQLFTLPVQMVFKGGTSLSKVFNIIKRFSEDCDITIDYRDFAEDLVKKAIAMALDGDVHALKLCIERLVPKATSQTIQFDMGKAARKSTNNLSIIGQNVLKSISEGELTLDDAHKLFGILDKQRYLIEFTDLLSKVTEIEELVKN